MRVDKDHVVQQFRLVRLTAMTPSWAQRVTNLEVDDNLSSTKEGTNMGPVASRLAILLDAFSPWDGISLTYKQFAAELGTPVTAGAVKKWPRRGNFPLEIARRIVERAGERGIRGVTLEWVLFGDGPDPEPRESRSGVRHSHAHRDVLDPHPAPPAYARPAQAPGEQLPVAIAAALQIDLGHNEFGQWSSLEVQHTVLWALKDLARRLRVLRFDMGQTFDLTDLWAARIGLPARPREPSGPDAGAEAGTPEYVRAAVQRGPQERPR